MIPISEREHIVRHPDPDAQVLEDGLANSRDVTAARREQQLQRQHHAGPADCLLLELAQQLLSSLNLHAPLPLSTVRRKCALGRELLTERRQLLPQRVSVQRAARSRELLHDLVQSLLISDETVDLRLVRFDLDSEDAPKLAPFGGGVEWGVRLNRRRLD
eukprot:221550-Pleurochrysis_carterae.AAC.2